MHQPARSQRCPAAWLICCAEAYPCAGTMKLGEGTASYDADTEVTERLPWEGITGERLSPC